MLDWGAYVGLFLAAFGTATVLPFQSEPVFVGLLLSGGYTPVTLIAIGSIGNVLGAALNWVLGRYIERFRGFRKIVATLVTANSANHRLKRFAIAAHFR